MKKIMEQTKVTAYIYLSKFGFDDEQINPLIEKGMVDLKRIISEVEVLLDRNTISWDKVDDALHALKGLLFHLGNNPIAEQIDEVRLNPKIDNSVKELRKLLI